MNTHSAPQSPQLVREQRRADTNDRSSSTRIEEAPAYWGFFKVWIFILLIFVLI